MLTLTDAAYRGRQFVKYGAVVVAVLILLRMIFNGLVAWWKATHPEPPPPVTVPFGKLPIPFPREEPPTLSYSLATVDGATGVFDPQMKVYYIPPKQGDLLALERFTDLAKKMGFSSEPLKRGDTVYRWTTDRPLPATLDYDLLTNHFTLEANWRVQPQLLGSAKPGSEAETIGEARNWFSGLRLFPDDVKKGEGKVTYLKVAGTQVVPALSQSEAQFVRVDLFRAPVDKVPLFPVDPKVGVLSITFLRQAQRQSFVIAAHYRYYPIDYQRHGTYPLISSQKAWERVQKGQAYYASVPRGVKAAVVRRVSLAYFDPPESGLYLQPIFVFEGDQGFVAYVTAVSEEFLVPRQ